MIIWILALMFLGLISYLPISAYVKSKKPNGKIVLIAKKSHSNRTLHFTKGKEYTFFKVEGRLIINQDDISGYRDNYSFYKKDLTDGFKATNMYSKMVLNQIKEIR